MQFPSFWWIPIHFKTNNSFKSNLHILLFQILVESLTELGMKHHKKGTIVTIEGPRFSTQAESLMFKGWGADVINMTTVPEVRVMWTFKEQRTARGLPRQIQFHSWVPNVFNLRFQYILLKRRLKVMYVCLFRNCCITLYRHENLRDYADFHDFGYLMIHVKQNARDSKESGCIWQLLDSTNSVHIYI